MEEKKDRWKVDKIGFQTKIITIIICYNSILGMIIVPILRKLKVGQIEREDGPESDLKNKEHQQWVE